MVGLEEQELQEPCPETSSGTKWSRGGAPLHQDDSTVQFYRAYLSCQIGEAVRIRRRGGAGSILNSKSEDDRCKIPRLILE